MEKNAWLNKRNHNVVRKWLSANWSKHRQFKIRKRIGTAWIARHGFTLCTGKNQSLINFRQQNIAILKTYPVALPGPLCKHHIMNITIGGMC